MKYEKSCGVIPFTERDGETVFMLIRSFRREYGFPKGHMEGAETELETAARELKEETNTTAEILDGFRVQIEYPLPKKPDTMKQVVYFLGKDTGGDPVPQDGEVQEIVFLPYEKAQDSISFASVKEVFRAAHDFLVDGKGNL